MIEIALMGYLTTNLVLALSFTMFLFHTPYSPPSKYEVLQSYLVILSVGVFYFIYKLLSKK